MRRLHYGWVVVGVGFTAWFFGGGLRDAFSVFVRPWADYFGWGIASISLAMTIELLVDAGLAPVGGSLADRFGARRVLAVFMLAMAIGALGIATMNSRWQLYLFFGVFIGMAASLGPITTLLVAQWFTQRRGMAFSLVSMGSHLGTATLAPLTVALFALGGWRLPWVVYGIMALALVPLAYWLLRRRPPAASSPGRGHARLAGATLAQAWRTPAIWMILTGAIICGYTTRSFWMFVVPIGLEGGTSTGQAALALSLAGLMNVPGLFVTGLAVDRFSKQKWLAMLFALRAVAFLGLALFLRTDSVLTLFLFAGLAGFVSRATGTVFQSLMVNCYGVRSLGTLSGIETLCHQVAAAAGALAGGLIFDATGSYTTALLLGAGVLVVGAVVSLRIPERRFYSMPQPTPEASA